MRAEPPPTILSRCHPFRAMLIVVATAVSVAGQATPMAQLNRGYAPPTDWMQTCESKLQVAPEGSDEQLAALLMRCIAVFNQDRKLCCSYCLDAESAALALGKRNVAAAARMIRAEALCDWKAEGHAEYESAKQLFDPETALPDFAIIYHLAKDQFERLDGLEPSPQQQFDGHDLIKSARFPEVKLVAEAFETMIFSSAGVDRERLKSLQQQAEELNCWDAQVGIQLQLVMTGEEPSTAQLEILTGLLEKTDKTNSSGGVKSVLLRVITRVHLEQGEYEAACEYVDRLCKTSRDLHSNSHLATALSLRIDNETGHKRLDLAQPVAEELTKLLPLVKNPNPKVASHRALLGYAIETNDKPQIYALTGALGSTLAEQQKNGEIRKVVYEELEKLRELSVVARAENESLTADRNVAIGQKRRYQILTLCGMILVSILAGFLYLSRRRVQRANVQLQEQVESNLRGQKLQEELTERVALAERMESLGALAGGIAHDFNNLLVGVVCNAEVLQMYHQQTPATEKCLNGILKAAETASDLSRKMLAYAGRQPSEKRAADLNELVRPMVSLAQSGLKDCDVVFVTSETPAVASIDETQVEQIVLNLINNAKEAVGDSGGQIKVSIGRESLGETYSDPCLIGAGAPNGDYVYIEVTDNGRGVPQSEIRRIFEPFHSSSSTRGRGLGLAVVYGHTNRHDGLIRVRSTVGKGTTIRVLLPECHTVPEAIRFDTIQCDLPESADILFVDDESIIRDVASRFIKQVHWRIKTCETGSQALDYLEQSDRMPDCICLDVVMPEMDGLEVIRRLGEKSLDIPVIVMSGYSNTNQQEFLDHPCVVDFLSKPFNTEQLLSAISKAIVDRRDATQSQASAISPAGSKLR